MIAAAALSVISLSSQVPAEIRIPDGIDAATLAVRVQATETHFLAQNASPYTQVLFLGTAQLGHAATLRLAPGAEVLFPFARGTIDNLWIETLAILPDGWLNTGALSIKTCAIQRMAPSGTRSRTITRSAGRTADAASCTRNRSAA